MGSTLVAVRLLLEAGPVEISAHQVGEDGPGQEGGVDPELDVVVFGLGGFLPSGADLDLGLHDKKCLKVSSR